jgi:hypothetical protein
MSLCMSSQARLWPSVTAIMHYFGPAVTNPRQCIAPIGYGRSSSKSFRDEFFWIFGLEVRMENELGKFQRAVEKGGGE